MGVKNLWDILESCKKTLPLHCLQNKRVCVDLSCWMVQLQNVNKSYCATKEKVYLRALFHRLRALIALNCSVIFVTDGSIPAIKLCTYRRRLNSGFEVYQDETSLQNVSSLRRNMASEFSCMIKEAKALGSALGIPCLDAIEEAEAQCALLNSEALCDGCFTLDSDALLFGARTVYRDICLGEGGYVICYEMADIEAKLGFGRNSLITLAILLGSDYTQGLYGVGPESACQIVKAVGDSVVLEQIASNGLCFAKKTKGLKKLGRLPKYSGKENSLNHAVNGDGEFVGNDHNPQVENPFLQVIDAYLKPKCHMAGSDPVQRVLVQSPFQHAKLREICTQFFGWPDAKTDEYILPKIAERDLRRFANLRTSSSDLGVEVPLHEMPVKCPVSGIVKHRKDHGKECFEVCWDKLYGLKTSVVPADLIQSACPEKIVEFEEGRAQGKRINTRKPRAKRSDNRVLVSDIELKLQNLLINIDSGSNTVCNPVLSDRSASKVDENTLKQDEFHESEIESRTNRYAITDCYQNGYDSKKIIDLVSPSPPMHCRTVSKRHQISSQSIDVINLSDSDTDPSPEHQRKARELRQFLATIRDDIYRDL